jgi:hypothetical protein
MATSSILGGAPAPMKPKGKNADALGPSDSSDSGSDVRGERPMPTAPDNPGEWGAVTIAADSDTDTAGTGERASASGEGPRDAADVSPDRVVGTGDATQPPVRGRRRTSDVESIAADDEEADADADLDIERPETDERDR